MRFYVRFIRPLIFVPALLAIAAGAQAEDWDGDGILDEFDNCACEPNADQYDADEDGFGNVCDGDTNNDGILGWPDFNYVRDCINRPGVGARAGCFVCDFDHDNRVDSDDFAYFLEMWGRLPGPSRSSVDCK